MSKKANKEGVAEDIRTILNAPHQAEAKRLLDLTVTQYESTESKLSTWMENNIPQSFSVFARPKAHHKRVRTSNLAERVNKEIRRRTKVVGIFPNANSCLRLISAILCEIHEDWMQGKIYLTGDELKT